MNAAASYDDFATAPPLPSPPIDPSRDLFPHCLVWSPLPVLTWFIPFIGHMGIATTDGIMWDFAGPYSIGKHKLAFGPPTRYIQLDVPPSKAREFDRAVAEANATYACRLHNLFCDNCHSHCARACNNFKYKGWGKWNMVVLCFYMFFMGQWVSPMAVAKTWGPFVVVLVVVLLIEYL